MSAMPRRAAFNLKRDAVHVGFRASFDVERHVQMWKFAPKRREHVVLVLQMLEGVFASAVAAVDQKLEERAAGDNDAGHRRKGARLKRGEDDVLRQQRGGLLPRSLTHPRT